MCLRRWVLGKGLHLLEEVGPLEGALCAPRGGSLRGGFMCLKRWVLGRGLHVLEEVGSLEGLHVLEEVGTLEGASCAYQDYCFLGP